MKKNYQINNMDVYDLIRYKYMAVYDQALRAELPVNNIQIRVRADLKECLEMGDTLLVGIGTFQHDVPVIVDDTIEESEAGEGYWQSTILIGDPAWAIWSNTGA